MHERERYERDRRDIDRDRERIHARERELAAQYDLNDDDIHEHGGRSHMSTMPATTHIRHTNEDRELLRERDDRYPLTSQSSHLASASRRDRTADDYSPHHGGGTNRRVHI